MKKQKFRDRVLRLIADKGVSKAAREAGSDGIQEVDQEVMDNTHRRLRTRAQPSKSQHAAVWRPLAPPCFHRLLPQIRSHHLNNTTLSQARSRQRSCHLSLPFSNPHHIPCPPTQRRRNPRLHWRLIPLPQIPRPMALRRHRLPPLRGYINQKKSVFNPRFFLCLFVCLFVSVNKKKTGAFR